MSQFLEGWLANEQAQQDVISVKRIYIDINDGNLYDGLMFSQIMYWHGNNKETHEPRMKIERDGQLWLAKAYTDWWEECRINEHTARKCINRIAERKLIVVNLWKFNSAPTLHLRIDWDIFESRVKSIWYDVSNPIDTTGQIQLIQEDDSLTEITSETTTETNVTDGDKSEYKTVITPPHIMGLQTTVTGATSRLVQQWRKPEDSLDTEPYEEPEVVTERFQQMSGARPAPKNPPRSQQVEARGKGKKKSSFKRDPKPEPKMTRSNPIQAPVRRATPLTPTLPLTPVESKIGGKTGRETAFYKSPLEAYIEGLAKWELDQPSRDLLNTPLAGGNTPLMMYSSNPNYKLWVETIQLGSYIKASKQGKGYKPRSDTMAQRCCDYQAFIDWVHDNDKVIKPDYSACEAEEEEFLKGRAKMTNEEIRDGLTAIRKKHGCE